MAFRLSLSAASVTLPLASRLNSSLRRFVLSIKGCATPREQLEIRCTRRADDQRMSTPHRNRHRCWTSGISLRASEGFNEASLRELLVWQSREPMSFTFVSSGSAK